MEPGQAPIFIVLNAAPEEIAFKLPKMPEYKSWQQVLNTTEAKQEQRRSSPPAPRPRRRRARCWPLRARHERNAIRREADEGRRVVSAVGAGGEACRSRCSRRSRTRCARGDGRLVSPLDVADAGAGTRYKFRIDDEIDVPDPASAFQPEDVFGPSEVIDHGAFAWRAQDWRGRPWDEAVLIETHVGTFTQDGTYRAMIDKLDHLVTTGITALELMPLADFAGRRGWGYDGVLWYAPDSAYGRPEDLKTLIDEAHLRGLMVFLDVVYNHFGPEGNYLGRYAPAFFTDAHTPWGSAIDYRVPQVRAFAIENALYWLRDYRFDGLQAGRRQSHHRASPAQPSMLHDLSVAAGELATATGRHIHLVLENGDNRASLLDAAQEPPRGKYRAQWNDDYHHAWHVLLTGETQGYYGDYQTPPRATSHARWRPALSIRARSRHSGATSRAASRAASCRRRPSSISCRTTTRSATARSATGWRACASREADRSRARGDAAGADDSDAVHGRGMGLEGALPVLLRFRGRSCRRRPQGAQAGIRLGL